MRQKLNLLLLSASILAVLSMAVKPGASRYQRLLNGVEIQAFAPARQAGTFQGGIPVGGLYAANTSPAEPGQVVTLTASITSGNNVVYHWTFGDGASGLGALVAHIYTRPGIYTAQVMAANDTNSLDAKTLVNIAYRLNLPVIIDGWPPVPGAPVVYPISNQDGDGNYLVAWDELPPRTALTYTLQEAPDPAFRGSLRTVCTAAATAPGLSCAVTGRPYGTWYYRARGFNAYGAGAWSLVQTAAITRTVPDDPYYDQQWALSKINAPAGWSWGTGAGIIIAIVDTGIDLKHPDLQTKLVPGYDFYNNDPSAQDDHGHGTHVAGIAAAVSSNGAGITGLGWDAQLMPIKVSNSQGMIYTSDVADGITWAVNHGAKVINMSLGGEGSSSTLRNATDYVYNHGALVVAAAGNCGDQYYYLNGCSAKNPVIYPAAYPNVLAVGATTSTDTRASFSNYRSYVDVAAPGVDIYATFWPATYRYLSGTSMASPLGAGLAALVWGWKPSLSNAQVAQVLMSTAVDLGPAGRDVEYGYGRLDVAAAMKALQSARLGAKPAQPGSDFLESGTGSESGHPQTLPVRPGVVLVRLKPQLHIPDASRYWQGRGMAVVGQLAVLNIDELSVPEGQERAFADLLAIDPAVDFAEPDYILHIF